jgi:cyclase
MRIHALIRIVPLLLCVSASAQEPAEQRLETHKLTDTLYLLTGPGGNIALLVGKDSVFLVDDQIAPMTPALKKTIAQITPKPVRFVFNTHWHGDHTGGNAVLGQDGAVIVAHDNVRKRMSTEQFREMFKRKVPPSPESALPVITFADSISFHLDGEDIAVFHVDPAHTDGDSIVWFKKADVVHTGDTFMSLGYPFIDISSGGTTDGFLRAADRVLAIAQPSTRIIPGHGSLADRNRLKTWRDMVATIRDRVQALVKQGKTLDQTQAAKPSAEFDESWGKTFITAPQLVEAIYRDLTRKR